MIAIYNSITSFVRMSGGQRGVLGGISHLINDVASWAKVLPRDPSTCGILNIMIQRPNIEGEGQRHYYKEVYSIRVEKVKAALLWLKANNVHYADVLLDFGKLDFWSRQPQKIEIIDDDDTKVSTSLGNFEVDSGENSASRVEETLIETSQDEDIAKKIASGLGQQTFISGKTLKSQDPVIKGIPYMGFIRPYTDKSYWEKAFPHLFPYGWGGPDDIKRTIPLTDAGFDKHALLDSSNRFSSSKQWIFARYKTSCSRSANSVSFVSSKFDHQTPTVRDLFGTRDHAKDGINRSRVRSDAELLLKKLSTFGDKMKTTHFYIKHARKHLMARLASCEMPTPTWFLTLSSADLFWPELWIAIAASKGEHMSFETAAGISFKDRCSLLDDNPALACRMFKARIDCMLNDIFLGEAHPLGYLVDWWFRVEFQNRGSLHVHTILWALLFYQSSWFNGDEMSAMMFRKVNEMTENESNATSAVSVNDQSSCTVTINRDQLCRFELSEMISSYMTAKMPTDKDCGEQKERKCSLEDILQEEEGEYAFIDKQSLDHASLSQKQFETPVDIPFDFDYSLCCESEQRDLRNLLHSVQIHDRHHRTSCKKRETFADFIFLGQKETKLRSNMSSLKE